MKPNLNKSNSIITNPNDDNQQINLKQVKHLDVIKHTFYSMYPGTTLEFTEKRKGQDVFTDKLLDELLVHNAKEPCNINKTRNIDSSLEKSCN